jgi:hypothetical protein
MTPGSLVSRLSAPLIALFLMSADMYGPVHAAEGLRKVTVVSFGLFGDLESVRVQMRKLYALFERQIFAI